MASLKKRGDTNYAQYYVNGKQKRVNLGTTSLQVAKDKLRAIESAMFRQEDIPLPTKTPISEILEKYIAYLKSRTSEKKCSKGVHLPAVDVRASLRKLADSESVYC